MGRNKIKIARIESAYARKETLKKRLAGLKKKATEFSILCDVPILLLTATSTGEFSLTMGSDCNFEDIIRKFAEQVPEARCKSLQDSIKKLANAYDKEDHIVLVEQFAQHRTQPSLEKNEIEQKKGQLALLQEKTSQLRKIMGPLGHFDELENVESLDTLVAMELALQNVVKDNRLKRDEIVKWNRQQQQGQQPHENTGMHLPVQEYRVVEQPTGPAVESNWNIGIRVPVQEYHEVEQPTGPAVECNWNTGIRVPVQEYREVEQPTEPAADSYWNTGMRLPVQEYREVEQPTRPSTDINRNIAMPVQPLLNPADIIAGDGPDSMLVRSRPLARSDWEVGAETGMPCLLFEPEEDWSNMLF